ncbi:hypothetical protein OCH239_11890 [Roseivivax halodurans JCM 10272]|uniref:CheW-like domain-containing protein n=2 Tax=Roseivivax halodurans TaxID=93683 RepID=X7EJ69_9RHOB|nr:hypothetical protein OCH239_11890 [Roseivivax halodurans JCM 10272]
MPPSEGEVSFGLLDIGSSRVGVDLRFLTEVCMIDRLAPLMTAAPEVLGVIDLRGTIVPILDPNRLCGLDPSPKPPTIAALLESDGRTIGLGIDRVVGLTEPAAGGVQRLFRDQGDGAFVTGGFFRDGRLVSCIDPAPLFGRVDLPAAASSLRTKRQGIATDTQAYLTFRAGGATFGLEALKISGTVPRQRIPRDSLTTDICLGSIRQHGRRIPVMQASAILGLGRGAAPEAPEVVVVRFPDERLLGLAVDVICRIALIRSADLQSPGPAFEGSGAPLRSVLVEEGGAQTFVLDHDALAASRDLAAMAALSDPTANADAGPGGRGTGDDKGKRADIIRDDARYMVFTARSRLATPIRQLVQILEPPRDVTPLSGPAGLMGLFADGGRLVPLVCLARRLGFSAAGEADQRRVLLVGPPDRRVGFVVDRVDGIEASEWRADDKTGLMVEEGLVKLRNEPNVLPRIDLEHLAHATTVGSSV